jgi:hypothetical protein
MSKGYGFVTYRDIDSTYACLREPSKYFGTTIIHCNLAALNQKPKTATYVYIFLLMSAVPLVAPDSLFLFLLIVPEPPLLPPLLPLPLPLPLPSLLQPRFPLTPLTANYSFEDYRGMSPINLSGKVLNLYFSHNYVQNIFC